MASILRQNRGTSYSIRRRHNRCGLVAWPAALRWARDASTASSSLIIAATRSLMR